MSILSVSMAILEISSITKLTKVAASLCFVRGSFYGFSGVGERIGIMAATISIIGAGRVGRTLGALMRQRAHITVQHVCSQTLESAEAAVGVIGAGEAVADLRAVTPSSLLMLSVPDSMISDVARRLAADHLVAPGTIVFHCSGALSSVELRALREKGAQVASVHPIRSFADPSLAIKMFEGTYITLEGDSAACESLRALFTSIGGVVLEITPHAKTLCHVGHVFASNYLVGVLDIARQIYRRAGIDDSVSTNFLRPIVHGTVENVLSLGTTKALTGPIMRGDVATVEQHSEVLAEDLPHLSQIYAALGSVVLEIAQRGGLEDETAGKLMSALERMSTVKE